MNKIKTVSHNLWYGMNFRGKPEAKGYLKLAASRGCFTVYGALYATVALNEIAVRTADCDGKIFNGKLKTSSAIAATVFIEAAVVSLLSPMWGVIADNISARKCMFMCAHLFWLGMIAFQIGLVSDYSPPASSLVLFIASGVLMSVGLELSIVLLVSYLPEICKDDIEIAALTGRGYAYINGMQLLLALVVTAIGFVFGIGDNDDEAFILAQIAGGLTIIIWVYFSIPGFRLLSGRPKETEGGACRSLLKLKGLFGDIGSTYPQIGIFLVSYMFFFAGVNNVVGLATQFLLAGVGVAPFTVSVVSAVLLVFAVIGALLIEPMLARFDLRKAYLWCILFWLLVTLIGPFVMQGEVVDQENATSDRLDCPPDGDLVDVLEPAEGTTIIVFLFGILYGVGIGTSFGLSQTLFAVIIPGGEESAYFGLKTVFSKLIAWAPALCYTAVNEALDDEYSYAFVTIAPFFFLAGVVGLFIDIPKAKSDIKHTLSKRHGYAEELDVKEVVASAFEDNEKDEETEKKKADPLAPPNQSL